MGWDKGAVQSGQISHDSGDKGAVRLQIETDPYIELLPSSLTPTTDGSTVTDWDDTSGLLGTAWTPTINGTPTVETDDTQEYLGHRVNFASASSEFIEETLSSADATVLSGTTSGVLVVWFRSTDADSGTLLCFSNTADADAYIDISLQATGEIVVRVRENGTSNELIVSTTATYIFDDQWHKVAVRQDGTSLDIWIDGVQATTAEDEKSGTSSSDSWFSTSSVAQSDTDYFNAVHIGCHSEGGTESAYFDGDITKVVVYDGPLSDIEMARVTRRPWLELLSDGVTSSTQTAGQTITGWTDTALKLSTVWSPAINDTPTLETTELPYGGTYRVEFDPSFFDEYLHETLASTDQANLSDDTVGAIVVEFKITDAGVATPDYLMSVSNTSNGTDAFYAAVANDDIVVVNLKTSTTNYYQYETTGNKVSDGKWHRLGIRQAAGGVGLEIWLDGRYETITESLNGDMTGAEWLEAIASDNSNANFFDDFTIGARRIGGSASEFWDGSMGEFRYFETAPTDEEMVRLTRVPPVDLYNEGITTSTQSDGETLTGWATNNGWFKGAAWAPTVVNTPTLETDDVPTNASYRANFSTNEYLYDASLNTLEAAHISDDKQGTFFAWFRCTDTGTLQRLFNFSNSSSAGNYASLYVSGDDINLVIRVNGSTDQVTYSTNSDVLSDDTWHKVAISHDGSVLGHKIYVDGVHITEDQTLNGTADGSEWLHAIAAYSDDPVFLDQVSVGALRTGSTPGNYLTGDLVDAKYFDWAMTDEELRVLTAEPGNATGATKTFTAAVSATGTATADVSVTTTLDAVVSSTGTATADLSVTKSLSASFNEVKLPPLVAHWDADGVSFVGGEAEVVPNSYPGGDVDYDLDSFASSAPLEAGPVDIFDGKTKTLNYTQSINTGNKVVTTSGLNSELSQATTGTIFGRVKTGSDTFLRSPISFQNSDYTNTVYLMFQNLGYLDLYFTSATEGASVYWRWDGSIDTEQELIFGYRQDGTELKLWVNGTEVSLTKNTTTWDPGADIWFNDIYVAEGNTDFVSKICMGGREQSTLWNNDWNGFIGDFAIGVTGAVSDADMATFTNPATTFMGPDNVKGTLSVNTALSAVVSSSANVTADLSVTKPMTADVTSAATATADLLRNRGLTASVTVAATATADLSVTTEFSADVSAIGTVTADLSVTTEFSADVSATGVVTADLLLTKLFSADVTATGNVTAAVDVTTTLSADVSASATVSAALGVLRPLSADISTSGTTTADLLLTKSFSADVSAVGSVVSALDVTTALSTDVSATGTVTADLSVQTTLDADVTSTGTVTADLLVVKSLSAAITATGTVASDLPVLTSFSADISATGTLSSDVLLVKDFTATVNSTGTMTAAMDRTRGFVIKKAEEIQGIGTATGDLSVTTTFVAAMSLTGMATADIVVLTTFTAAVNATGTVSADLIKVVNLSADVSSTGVVAADLIVTETFSAAVSSTGTVTADLSVTKPLSAVVSTSGTMTAAEFDRTRGLTAVVSSTGTTTADLAVTTTFAAAASTTATVTADLSVTTTFVANVTSSGVSVADLSVTETFVAAVSSTGTVTADLSVTKPLTAAVSSVGTMTADLLRNRGLSAVVSATSSTTGDVSVTTTFVAAMSGVATLPNPILDKIGSKEFIAHATASGTLAADLSVHAALDANVSGTGTLTAALDVSKTLSADVSATATAAADVQALIGLSAAVSAAGTTAAAVSVTTTFSGVIASTGTLNDPVLSVSGTRDFTADVSSTGTMTADLNVLTAFAAVHTVSSSMTADVGVLTAFSASMSGTATLADPVLDISGSKTLSAAVNSSGSMTADLSVTTTFSTAVNSTGTVTADLSNGTAKTFIGAVNGVGTVTADLSVTTTFYGVASSTSTVSAALDVLTSLVADVRSTGQMGAALSVTKPFVADVSATGTLSTDLSVTTTFVADVSATSAATADVQVRTSLMVSFLGVASVTSAPMLMTRRFTAAISGTGTMGANLDKIGLDRQLSGSILGTATMTVTELHTFQHRPIDLIGDVSDDPTLLSPTDPNPEYVDAGPEDFGSVSSTNDLVDRTSDVVDAIRLDSEVR